MIPLIKESLWKQFGASIDMLENAIVMCPEGLFATHKRFYYTTYHVLVFLEYYLTNPPEGFTPVLPYTVTDMDKLPEGALDDLIPSGLYTKQELLDYLHVCRRKCYAVIDELTENKLNDRWIAYENGAQIRNYPMFEMLLNNMRHVQHHAAQLNMILRQHIDNAPDWVSRAKRTDV